MAKIKWHGKSINDKVEMLARKQLAKAALVIVGQIKAVVTEKHIVDTGLLRSSISYTMDDGKKAPTILAGADYPSTPNKELSARVGTTVFYAPFHEFGTRSRKPRPYIRPGFERAKSMIKSLFNIKDKL